jgi:uncharacterized protein (TIGR03435 family)
MRRLLIAIVGAFATVGQAKARHDVLQSPAFEVVSVKPHPPELVQPTSMVAEPGGRFTARNIPLRLLIRTAYQIQDDQIVDAPGWVTSDRFDIAAKAEDAASPADLGAMLQALLADRFKLAVHRETRQLPIFELLLARSDGALGPRMKQSECVPDINARPATSPGGPPRCGSISNGFGRLTLSASPIPVMAQFLSPVVSRVVLDRTGLSGNFDVDLTWTPDRLPSRPPGAPPDQTLRVNGAEIDPNGPSIFTAVREQLGLKLESGKGPVNVLAIDHIEHPSPD